MHSAMMLFAILILFGLLLDVRVGLLLFALGVSISIWKAVVQRAQHR